MNKQIKIILYSLLAISLIACGYTAVFRMQSESKTKNVQIAVRYSDVLSIAQQKKMSIEAVLKELKAAGATTLFVRENSVMPSVRGEFYNYKEQGKVTVSEGYQIQAAFQNDKRIAPQLSYIQGTDKELMDLIYNNLLVKNIPVDMFTIGDNILIEVDDFSNSLTTIGVGFNYGDLEIAADLDYVISPQIKAWDKPSDESIKFLMEQLSKIKNLGPIYFADQTIPGYKSVVFQQFIAEKGLGFVEFFSANQEGFKALAKKSSSAGTNFKVARLHTLTDEEVKKYKPADLLDRYELALKERNLKVFLFKMPANMNIQKDSETFIQSIKDFKEQAILKGYTISNQEVFYNLPMGNYVLTLLAGLGAIALFVLLLDRIGFAKLGLWLGSIGFVGYAGLLKVSPAIGIKLMALFGAVVFPTYAVISVLNAKHGSYKNTLFAYLKTSAISFGGALTIVGALSRTSYALGIDIFSGVKIATVLPILLIIIIDTYKRHGLDYKYYKQLLLSKVSYLAIGILGVLGIALIIYTVRTGNSGEVSQFERSFRELLDNLLGVRPRTKEFLIGHPIFVALLYYGYKEKYVPFLVFAAIGQISLVNTYAHIHTPLMVSLIRSAYGLFFGFIIGLIFIGLINIAVKVTKKWIIQQK